MAALRFHLAFMVYALIVLCGMCQDSVAATCDPSTCKLPDCFCAGRIPPSGLSASQIPQMVLFTFDDAVNTQVYGALMEMFGPSTNRKNPGGCSIGMTLFVSHMYTNHCAVAEFYRYGHEVASHTITHKEPITYWRTAPYEEYDLEIDGQRLLLSTLAGIPVAEITGYRSPFIQPGGDVQFSVLRDRKFTYDSSLLVFSYGNQDRIWPYTLDFPNQLACGISPCPQKPYPGMWELPIQSIPDHTGAPCNFLDRCKEATTEEEVYGYLMKSFNTSYSSNRAPLILNMHAYWFNDNDYGLKAFIRFIDEILERDDVYIITASQLVAWMRTPTPLGQKPYSFAPWECTERTMLRCTKKILKPGMNRTKKPDFEEYKSKMKKLYSSNVNAPEDGGVNVMLGTLAVFIVAFIYLLFQEAS